MKNEWTRNENAALVALYFMMLDLATVGTKYNKSGLIRVAQNGIGPRDLDGMCDHATPFVGLLGSRSKGSIEAKLMNVTAAHRDLIRMNNLDGETMDGFGYRALSNYQISLKVAVRDALSARPQRDGRAEMLARELLG